MNPKYMYMYMNYIDVTKSTGIDEITGRMIKNTGFRITSAVSAILSQSISEGKFPTEWKKGHITPVPMSYDHLLNC